MTYKSEVRKLGVILFSKGQDIDSLFESVNSNLQSRQLKVAGFLQHGTPADGDDCCKSMYIEDLKTGDKLEISQALGSGSKGCRLNPAVLADATAQILNQLDESPDFIILNRFGKGEADGAGFRPVIEKGVELNIPTLIAVRDPYIADLKQFCGDCGQLLPFDFREIMSWSNAALAGSQHQTEVA